MTTHKKHIHIIQTCFQTLPDPNPKEQAKAFISTHSHECDYLIHIRSDVALHKGHQHSQLLEQKLKQKRGRQVDTTKDMQLPSLPRVHVNQ